MAAQAIASRTIGLLNRRVQCVPGMAKAAAPIAQMSMIVPVRVTK